MLEEIIMEGLPSLQHLSLPLSIVLKNFAYQALILLRQGIVRRKNM
jgi:hypothetical protein